MHLHGVRKLNIPELQLIDGDLNIGAFSWRTSPLSNCSTALAEFSAPKLSKITGSLNVANSSLLRSVSFPALRTIGGDVRISGTPAVDLEKGLKMPKLRQVHSVQVVGSAPHCEDWDGRWRRGVMWGKWYWCGDRAKWTVQEMDDRLRKDQEAADQSLKDRFGINDCYPYERRWCVNGKGLDSGGMRTVWCVMAVVVLVFWWARSRRRGRILCT